MEIKGVPPRDLIDVRGLFLNFTCKSLITFIRAHRERKFSSKKTAIQRLSLIQGVKKEYRTNTL